MNLSRWFDGRAVVDSFAILSSVLSAVANTLREAHLAAGRIPVR